VRIGAQEDEADDRARRHRSPSTGPIPAFDAWLDDFFAHYYARRPVNATFIGVHTHDHELPDLSPEGTAEAVREMRALRSRLAQLPEAGLDEPRRHDRRLADGFLDLQILEHELPQAPRFNPTIASGEGVFSVISLFLRDAEPLAERVDAAIARMEALPAFLERARAGAGAAPTPWTERAIRESHSATAYFERGLPLLAAARGIDAPRFLETARAAAAAFAAHAAWLEGDLLARPSKEVACGRDAFERFLQHGHCLPAEQDAVWVEEAGWRAFEQAQANLERAARAIDPLQTWPELLAALPDHHPGEDRYAGEFGRVWDVARQAALDHDLVTWPDSPIAYVPTPPWDREAAAGLYYLPYLCPPPFGRPETHRYLIAPLEAGMAAAERERVLRANHEAAITLNHVVHHGGLGHHVQNWYAFRAASRIGRMAGVDCASRIACFSGGTLVEGWACYATDLMDEIGFLSPLTALAELQSRLRMAARAIVDVRLHSGGFSLDEAASFYEAEAGMTAAAARGEAVKNSLFPGAAMMYLVGTEAIHDLRRRVAERDGDAFSLRAFHDRFLGYGAIPVPLIAASMLGKETPAS
jgi:uncharacterized protein (DUF885 family)